MKLAKQHDITQYHVYYHVITYTDALKKKKKALVFC